MTVNVSPEQLGNALLRDIAEALDVHGLPATSLVLELTETSLLHDSESALALLAQLRSLGIQIAIDDFGTGYSSLRYLRRFPVDILKIAKPFIDGIEQEDGQEWAFARLITDLATTLGLITVAEGIEVAGTARPPRRARLHLRAGPPLRPSRRRGRHRRPARGRPRSHRPTARRVTRRPRPVEVHLDWTTSV